MADTIPPGMPMGQTVELSPGDIDSVARLYGHVPTEHAVSTNPAGLEIIVDGVRMTAPTSFFNWEPGSEHTLEVPSPQYRNGARFLFGRWSDDGSRAHTVTVNQDSTLFQASFVAQYQVATTASPVPHAGSVTIHPAPDADRYHTLRAPIELTATPAANSTLPVPELGDRDGLLVELDWVRLFFVGGRERLHGFCEWHGKSYLTRRRLGEEGAGGGSVTGGAMPSA